MNDFFLSVDPILYDLSMPFVVPGLADARQARRCAFEKLVPRDRAWVGADIGIGTGSDAETIFPPSARGLLYGVDGSALLTAELAARATLPSFGEIQVQLVPTDFGIPGSMATISDSNPGGVDFVTSAFAIHNVPLEQQRTAFENVAHILKSGGHFFYMDLITYEDRPLGNLAHATDLAFIRDQMGVVPTGVDSETWRRLQHRWLEHYEAENFLLPLDGTGANSVTKLLKSAGFRVVETLYRNFHTTLLLAIRR